MDEQDEKVPDLLWSCFTNWLNTIEKAFKLNSEDTESLKEYLGM